MARSFSESLPAAAVERNMDRVRRLAHDLWDMIKFVMCLHRRPDLTREQFQDYCLREHGPFFMKHAGDLRAGRYVQSLTLDTPLNTMLRESRGMQPEFDGVAEVWFESEEDMVAAMSSPEGQKLATALHEDEKNFIDHARSSAFLVREHEA